MESGHVKQVESVMAIESAFAKLPVCLEDEWGDLILNMSQDSNLIHMRGWLQRRIIVCNIASAVQYPSQLNYKQERTQPSRENRRTVVAIQKGWSPCQKIHNENWRTEFSIPEIKRVQMRDTGSEFKWKSGGEREGRREIREQEWKG